MAKSTGSVVKPAGPESWPQHYLGEAEEGSTSLSMFPQYREWGHSKHTPLLLVLRVIGDNASKLLSPVPTACYALSEQ